MKIKRRKKLAGLEQIFLKFKYFYTLDQFLELNWQLLMSKFFSTH